MERLEETNLERCLSSYLICINCGPRGIHKPHDCNLAENDRRGIHIVQRDQSSSWLGDIQDDVPGFLKKPEYFGQVLAKEAEHHPILNYFQKAQDGSAVTFSDFVTDREFRETVLSREFYQPLEIPRIIGLALRIGSSHSITLARHKNGREFGEHTRTTLNAIRPHLRRALENALAVTRMQNQLTVMNQIMEEGQQALISVTEEGGIRFVTRTPRGY